MRMTILSTTFCLVTVHAAFASKADVRSESPAVANEQLNKSTSLRWSAVDISGENASSFTVIDENHQSSAGTRKLLQRGRGWRGGRAGAVRVGGGGFRRASMGRRGGFTNFNRNNFIRGGFQRPFRLIGGAGFLGGFNPYYGGIIDPYVGGRAFAYQAPMQVQVPVPVPVPVPVSTPGSMSVPLQNPILVAPPPVADNDAIADALRGTWRGDGGGAGMGAIMVTVSENGGILQMNASPSGCGACALSDCRWTSANGPITASTADGIVTIDASFVPCAGQGENVKVESARGSLVLATNQRNVIYWSPGTQNTQWIKN